MFQKDELIRALEGKKCLKIIAGINNYDKENVMKIAAAAHSSGASALDICDQEDIIKEVRAKFPHLPLFVSSVEPAKLQKAMDLGADVLELGNFEVLYAEGIFYSSDKVLGLAKEIMEFAKSGFNHALVSITVPGHLDVAEQCALAEKLEELGVDIIQTEGASLVNPQGSGALGHIQKVSLTLANTMEISKSLEKTFLLTASGISPSTAPLAAAAGAHGVGVGKYVNKLETEIEMLAAAKSLVESLEEKATKRDLAQNINY